MKCILKAGAFLFVAGLLISNAYLKSETDDFCGIINRTQPGTILAENSNSIIIESRRGRPLSIPKKHIESLKEIKQDNVQDLADVFLLAAQTYDASLYNFPYFGLPYNYAYFHAGKDAGQSVLHLHMHIHWDDVAISASADEDNDIIVGENNYAKIMASPNRHLLFIIPKNALGHLNNPTLKATELAQSIALGSKILREQYSDKDYSTHIFNDLNEQQEPTVKIIVVLELSS